MVEEAVEDGGGDGGVAVEDGGPLLVGLVGGEHDGPALVCLLYTSPSPRDRQKSRMPSSA